MKLNQTTTSHKGFEITTIPRGGFVWTDQEGWLHWYGGSNRPGTAPSSMQGFATEDMARDDIDRDIGE